jgi:hypothetical protein
MENYKYYCEKCNYGTNIKASMEKHNDTEIHKSGINGKTKNKKIFICDKCDFTSSNKNNFLTHKLNNHGSQKERKAEFKYYCDICDIGCFVESIHETHLNSIKHKRMTVRIEKSDEKNKD